MEPSLTLTQTLRFVKIKNFKIFTILIIVGMGWGGRGEDRRRSIHSFKHDEGVKILNEDGG
jgi:hypothetical protein